MKIFENFVALQDFSPSLARQLTENHGLSDWQYDVLCVYFSIEGFVDYELTDGWYQGMFDRDFRGAPNPINYIDKQKLGLALMDSWDASIYWTNGEVIISTSYGW